MLSKVALTDFAESDSAGFITTTALSFLAITVVIFLVDLQEANETKATKSISNTLIEIYLIPV
jgi:hypothetical protein